MKATSVNPFRKWFAARPPVEREPEAVREAQSDAEVSEAAEVDTADPERLLVPFLTGKRALDADDILERASAMRAQGFELRAVRDLRDLLAHHPKLERVRPWVAETLAARGDDRGAWTMLAPLLEPPDPPLPLLMLAAEVKERAGDLRAARRYYEAIIARDIAYPRARQRVERLREKREPTVHATLLGSGALTRGRYRIERELGRGGAGIVFVAHDQRLERRVALKVYHRRGKADLFRLRLEGRIPAGLEHPGIVRVFDLDESLFAIAMEHLEGRSLRDRLGGAEIPAERALQWLQTAAAALAYAHAEGWVHRDVKPSNLLLRESDTAVLTDFGIAARRGARPLVPGEGSRAYMSPEQQAGAPAEPSADVYALGATMRDVCERLAAGDIKEHLREWSLCCMRRDPAARPDAEALTENLRAP